MKKLQDFFRREVVKISSLNSLSVGLKITGGLITSKVIAVFIGPTGMALTGNLRSFLSSVEALSFLGMQNGIVKYTADAQSETEVKKILSTVMTLLLFSTIFLVFFLFFLADFISAQIFIQSTDYSFVIKTISLALPWYVVSTLLLSVLNGLGKYNSVLKIGILGNLLGVFLSVFLILKVQTNGALLAIVLAPALQFFIVIFFVKKHLKWQWFLPLQFSRQVVTQILEYALMWGVAAIGSAIIILAVRTKIMETLTVDFAGYWEGVMRVSSYYMLFLSTILSVYYLPMLVKAKTRWESRAVYVNYFTYTIPVFLLGLVALFYLRDFVIKNLFSAHFQAMKPLFFWQILGDFLKALSLILGYTFFAKKLTWAFLFTEIFSLLILYLSSIFLLKIYGITGVVMAHALTYAIYLAVLVFYFRKTIFNFAKPSNSAQPL